MTGLDTSAIAARVAASGSSPFSSIFSVTASTTTIASSTTRPMASTSANSVSVLIEKPSATKMVKVPSSDTGTASIGIRVARQLSRNRNTTSSTSAVAMNNVISTSLIDSRTNSEVSSGIE